MGVSAGDAFDDVGLMSLGDEEDPAIRHRIARVVAQDASDASAPLQPYIPLDLLRIGLGEFTDNHRRFVPGGVHPQWIVIAIGADVQRHFKLAIGMALTHRPAVPPRNLIRLLGVRHAPFPTCLFDRLAGLVIEQLPDHPHVVRFRLSRLGRSIRGPSGRFLLRRQFLWLLHFEFQLSGGEIHFQQVGTNLAHNTRDRILNLEFSGSVEGPGRIFRSIRRRSKVEFQLDQINLLPRCDRFLPYMPEYRHRLDGDGLATRVGGERRILQEILVTVTIRHFHFSVVAKSEDESRAFSNLIDTLLAKSHADLHAVDLLAPGGEGFLRCRFRR